MYFLRISELQKCISLESQGLDKWVFLVRIFRFGETYFVRIPKVAHSVSPLLQQHNTDWCIRLEYLPGNPGGPLLPVPPPLPEIPGTPGCPISPVGPVAPVFPLSTK